MASLNFCLSSCASIITSMKIKILFVTPLVVLSICCLVLRSEIASLASNATQDQDQVKPAEQVFKNIQVFKGLPSSQLRPAMSFMAAALGVNCEHCHTNPWDSDVKPPKQ